MISLLLAMGAGIAVIAGIGVPTLRRPPIRSGSRHMPRSHRGGARASGWFFVGCGVGCVGIVVSSPTILIVGPAIVWWSRRFARRRTRRRGSLQLQREVVAVVDATALHVRSGSPLIPAFNDALGDPGVERLWSTMAELPRLVASGERFEVALAKVAESRQDTTIQLVSATIGTLIANGGPAGPALERLSETLRGRLIASEEARAQASQAMASGAVMASLPLVFGGLVAIIEPDVAPFYLRDPVGLVCVAVSAALTAGGWLWMEQLIGGDSP